ncbi:uncharacterized protein METZ01_LOCUS322483, partial [marine metagenome]
VLGEHHGASKSHGTDQHDDRAHIHCLQTRAEDDQDAREAEYNCHQSHFRQ